MKRGLYSPQTPTPLPAFVVKNYFTGIITLVTLLCIPAWSDNLYLDLVDQARPDQETLKKSRKQIEEHKEVKIINELSVSSFHKHKTVETTRKQPLCFTCHLPLPHRENMRSRSFLNMHTQYIACETCHLQPENVSLDYAWLAYDGEQTGQRVDATQAATAKPDEPLPSIIPILEARIAPFYKGQPALIFKDDAEVKKITERWENGTQEEKSQLKAVLHLPLNNEGRKCKECHRDSDEPGPLDLKALGASEEQQRAISQNIIAQFFRRYKKGDERKKDERIRMTDLLENQKPE